MQFGINKQLYFFSRAILLVFEKNTRAYLFQRKIEKAVV